MTYHQRSASVKGYTLVTPLGGDSAFLLDMDGRIVHRWRPTDVRPFYGRLLPDGHLLMLGTDASLEPQRVDPQQAAALPLEQRVWGMGGNATHLQEVDWEGNVVWQYRNELIHHDFVRLPNGKTLLPVWVEMPDDIARRVRGGFRGRRGRAPRLVSDDIIEIDPDGNEVWRISVWQLLDPARDPICPLEHRSEWTHLNSLDCTPEGNIVFSSRQNSRVGIIDRSAGTLLWKYGSPHVFHQHHATVLRNGNIQIFDNGMHRLGMPRSQIVEVNPKDSSTVWAYEAEPDIQFFSAHISGAERLPGGNVLICEGAPGRVLEVTRRGEVVWEWVSPFVNRVRGRRSSAIFRAHRYPPDFPGLAGRPLDPEAHADLNRLHGL